MYCLCVGHEIVREDESVERLKSDESFRHSARTLSITDEEGNWLAVMDGGEWRDLTGGEEDHASDLSADEFVYASRHLPGLTEQWRKGIVFGFVFDRRVREAVRSGRTEE